VEQPLYDSDHFGQEQAIELNPSFLRVRSVTDTAFPERIGERSSADAVIRRALDISMSLLLLAILSPVFLVLAVIIKLDSRGPVFFTQRRVGRDGKTFILYKFRSMVIDAEERKLELLKYNEASGPLFKIKRDPRVTSCGRWMRRLSFDELPQLFNVLRGEMSFVGPRPSLPSEVAQYSPAHMRRLSVKPGITGLSQVSGRSDLPFERLIAYDMQYIEKQSIWTDFKIVLRTLRVVFLGHGAY